MNESLNAADPFGWFAQLGLAHQQWATLMRSTLQASPLDSRGKSQWDFVLRQVIDATSPKNYLATNPEARASPKARACSSPTSPRVASRCPTTAPSRSAATWR
jgi:hypothetical protein